MEHGLLVLGCAEVPAQQAERAVARSYTTFAAKNRFSLLGIAI
jgi:hypothetical protein